MMEPQAPHEALSLVLSYLNLFELLSMNEVCRSLRDAVKDDLLLWLDIIIGPPLNVRLNDNILLKITSKAEGRLRNLALINCVGITDDGLQRVIDNNPHINKLYVPGCTRLTPDGIVRIVKMLTDHESGNHNLKYLRLHGLYNITKEHLQLLNSCLQVTPDEYLQNRHYYMSLDHQQHISRFNDDNKTNSPIDVEICQKCENVRLVFDCPRETCREKRETPLMECRGCCICIPRCEGCGGCINNEEEIEETVCLDVVCLNCWLQLPKCNFCNKPYCHRHACKYGTSNSTSSSTGFICDVCTSRILTENEVLGI